MKDQYGCMTIYAVLGVVGAVFISVDGQPSIGISLAFVFGVSAVICYRLWHKAVN